MTREEALAFFAEMIAYNDERARSYEPDAFKEDMKRAYDAAVLAYEALQPWVRTADRVPEKEDADAWGMVLATHRPFGGEPFKVRYPCVRNRPFDHVWWMPIPPLPPLTEVAQ